MTKRNGLLRLAIVSALLCAGAGMMPGYAKAISSTTVEITTDTSGDQYGGNAGSSGDATYNTLTISGAASVSYSNGYADVYGGYTASGNVNENVLKVTTTGTIYGNAYGGYTRNGDANTNKINFSNGKIYNILYGGRTEKGAANTNAITISGGKMYSSVYSGYSGNGNVTGNTVTISGGTIGGYVYGGYAIKGNATSNAITFEGGTLSSSLIGGYAGNTGNAERNKVKISGGTISGAYPHVYGGQADSGIANLNEGEITGGTITGNIYGGQSDKSQATNNKVTISGSATVIGTAPEEPLPASTLGSGFIGIGDSSRTQPASIYGGYSNASAAVTGNTVTSESGTIYGSDSDGVYGGYSVRSFHAPLSSPTGDVTDNTVKITGGTTERSIYGGYAEAGNAIRNHFTMEDGVVGTEDAGNLSDVNEDFYGGYSQYGSANENTVTISGGTIYGEVHGGRAEGAWIGDNEYATGDAIGNSVTISGGTIHDFVYGGFAGNGRVEGNTVDISNGTVTGSVYGGGARESTSTVTDNTVRISGGTIGATNGYGVCGGFSVFGSTNKNTVTISDGTIIGYVTGGYSEEANATGNTVIMTGGTMNGMVTGGEAAGAADYNTVTITGGKISGRTNPIYDENFEAVIGSITIGVAGGYSYGSTASNNTVNIFGGTFGEKATLYGGYGTNSTNNTLNLFTKGITVAALDYFQNLNFYIPADMTEADTMLNVTGTANIAGATIKAGLQSEDVLRTAPKTLTLLKAGTLTTDANTTYGLADSLPTLPEDLANTVSLVTASYLKSEATVRLGDDGSSVIMEFPSNTNAWYLSKDTKLFAETRAAGAALVGNATDIAATTAYADALAAAAGETSTGFAPYVSLGGFNLRNETGSYVDTNGLTANLGFIRQYQRESHVDSLMPFIEYGTSNYTSHLDSGARADGKQHYIGAGLLARRDLNNGLHYEALIRAGKLHGDFKGIIGSLPSSYNTNAPYIAAELGMGKLVTQNTHTIDYYGKLIWTRLGSDSTTIHNSLGKTNFDFDAINSYRTRLGIRWTKHQSDKNAYYAGLGWDYEFDGDSKANYRNFNTPSPSMKGSSGFVELGWQSKITKDNPWAADLHATAWTGKQRGVTYGVSLARAF